MKRGNPGKRIFVLAGVLLALVLIFLTGSNWLWNSLNPFFYKDILYRNAGEYKIDPLFAAAIIHCESSFNPLAVSKAGALGLMQLMPETAAELALEKKIDYVNPEELYKPAVNIELGFVYLSRLKKRYGGNRIFALAAYNAGLKKADEWAVKYGGGDEEEAFKCIEYPETRKFISDVLGTYRWFKALRKIKRTLQFKQ